MGLQLEKIVPWGRSLAEYTAMFDLRPEDLTGAILDCGGGPASFNAELTQQGYTVISCDPIYQFTADQIAQRIQETYSPIIEGVRANQNSYVWQNITSPEHLGAVRMSAMQKFLADFPTGLLQGRYQTAELPQLPFSDRQFDLALCSHLLFTYSQQLSATFHIEAIAELCRVAQEARIFPLLNISGEPSPHLPIVLEQLRSQGYQAEICQVAYEFQKAGNQMLRISR